ncbi:uncharacterized protein An12g03850, partial [Aspergillus niger]|uniref:RNA helicase n=1 Tax=Aspergillus niger TaxID=5061 RepID=A0AAJ8BY84_ASPNG
MSSPLAGWQAVRSMATVRQRRQAARMVLSSNVDKSSLKQGRSKRDRAGPWSGMNQTEARLRDAPRSRSRAALKRSGDSEDDKQKPDSPLYKALKMQTALAPIPYGRRTAIKNKIAEVSSFDQFPLLPVVRHSISSQALSRTGDIVPTPIQRLAIPQLLKDPIPKRTSKDVSDHEPNFEQYLLAAETGSGKTLAYLIPLIDSLKRMEVEDKEFEKPRVIILVPTSELVAQVGAKVKALSHTVKYRSGMISSNLTPRRIKSILFNPSGIDILVATPHLLASIAKTDPYVLSRVSHLVLDEADSLMDRSFLPTTTEIIEKSASSLHKLILCSATIPRSLDNLLRKRYPDIRRLTTPNLHAIPRRVQLGVVDIQRDPYRGNRSLACADVIWSIGKAGDTEPTHPFLAQAGPKVKKILVFVNEREEADEVAQFLRSKGIDAQSFSRDSSSRKQEELLEEFTESPIPPTAEEIMLAKNKRRQDNSIPFVFPEQQNKPGAERGLPNTKVLVTTDIASRGIDTIAVKTVILYHVPHNTIDFIHRLGRLGRMGKRGRAVVLVGKKDRKDVVKEVREGMFRGQALI